MAQDALPQSPSNNPEQQKIPETSVDTPPQHEKETQDAKLETRKATREIAEEAESAQAEKKQEEIEAAIEATSSSEPTTPAESPTTTSPGILTRIGETAGKIGDYIAKTFSTLSASAIRGFQAIAGALGFKKFAEMLGEYVEPSDIREAMEKTLGKKIIASAKDKEVVRKLHEQHEAIVQASNGSLNKGTFSFEKFYKQKIENLKKEPPREEYTMVDLLDAKTQDEIEQGKKDTDAQQATVRQNEANAEAQQLTEKMENPEVRRAVYTYALANALKKTGVLNLKLDQDQMNKDLTGERTDEYYAPKIAAMIQNWLSKSSWSNEVSGAKKLGISIDGKTLELDDGHNWWYDPNLLESFDLINDGPSSIGEFLKLDLTQFELNPTAKRNLPGFQKALQESLAEYIGSSAPTIPESAPEVPTSQTPES